MSSLSCGTPGLHCIMWDLWLYCTGSPVAAHGLRSCSVRPSVVMAHRNLTRATCGLICSMACGTLVLWPGLIPTLPAAEGEVLTNGPPGTCPLAFFQILSLVPQGLHTSCFPQIFSLFSLCLIPSHALDLNLEVTSSETFPDFPTHHPHYAP